jgi:threonine/homoserine/homoserine lactone efflux protein
MLGQLVVLVTLTSLVMVTPGPDMMLVLRNTFLAAGAPA